MRASLGPPLAALTLAAATLLGSAAPAAAQPGSGHWELNLHAAALRPGLFDESSEAWQFGGRLAHNFGSGIVLGASVDRAASPDVTLAPVAGLSATLLLYGLDLGYQTYMSPRSVFLLSAGVGAARVSIEDPPPGVTPSSTGLLIPLGLGMKFHNRAVAPSWAFRFDVRDNVILLEEAGTDGSVSNEPRHNPELSLGLSFLFGGGQEEPVRDADRDGVPDPRDQCLNRPGTPVDARGCPLEPEAPPAVDFEAQAVADEDGDGVPDIDDGCLGTGPDIEVQADGCPVLPDPAAPGVPSPGDSDGDGVPDELDRCPGTRAGLEIDERGCLARPDDAAAEPEAADPEVAEPLAAEPAPEVGPTPAACLSGEGTVVEFDGRRFRPLGFPQEVDPAFLVRVGTHDGLPLYVSDSAEAPYGDLWVPRCEDAGLFELYVEAAGGS